MRALLFLALLIGFAASGYTAAADDKKPEKIDPAKLVGRWQGEAGAVLTEGVLEFTKDGKFVSAGVVNKKPFRYEGTYKVDGDKLTVVTTVEGRKDESTLTVVTLTDAELVTADPRFGTKNRYARLKDK